MRVLLNPRRVTPPTWRATESPGIFHRSLPGYRPTEIIHAEQLAAECGLAEIWIKAETDRFGLPSFKPLGAFWAVRQAISRLLEEPLPPDVGLAGLREAARELAPLTLVTATDGNHGRAVARMAQLLGVRAAIYVPRCLASARVQAIEQEGAKVISVRGTYDDAVTAAVTGGETGALRILDTAYVGYEQSARDVIIGYSTMFMEIDAQLQAESAEQPTLVVIPVGCGSLAAAAVRHYHGLGDGRRPVIVSVEPTVAACAMAAAENGQISRVPGRLNSIMEGLNCGVVSSVAWPWLQSIQIFVAIGDDIAVAGMRALAELGIHGGECSGGSIGALLELMKDEAFLSTTPLGLGADTRVLVLATEGVTNPAAYRDLEL